MTSEEKAKEIIEKMMPLVDTHGWEGDLVPQKGLSNAKEAALIVAVQVQESFEATMNEVSNTYSDVLLDQVIFWRDVYASIKAYGRVSRRGTREEDKPKKTYRIIVNPHALNTERDTITEEGAKIIWAAYEKLYGNSMQTMDRREERGGIAFTSEIDYWKQIGALPEDFDYKKYLVE